MNAFVYVLVGLHLIFVVMFTLTVNPQQTFIQYCHLVDICETDIKIQKMSNTFTKISIETLNVF